MKVLIADDHALFRDGLGMRLEQIDPNVVILQASSFGQALKILDQEKKIDLVVLDLDMPHALGGRFGRNAQKGRMRPLCRGLGFRRRAQHPQGA